MASCSAGDDVTLVSFKLPDEATHDLTELFRISSPADGAFFSYIRNIHILSDGHLVVQNYPDHQLYELTPDGELVGIIGREGRGPGEFIQTYMSHLAIDDSLHVFDFNNSRHQVFTRDEPGQWTYSRESAFQRVRLDGLKEQIPDRVVRSTDGETFGLFRIHPTARDTLQAQYMYVSKVDQNIEHAGDVSRLRLASELAIHRGENNSMSVINNRRFKRSFYTFRPETDEVLLIQNTSNDITVIDSSGKETVNGQLPYERFPVNRRSLDESLVNVNYSYAGMEEIVQDKLLDYEPYYRNVVLHDNRLWVNLARSDSDKPNWVVTTLEGELLEAFHGPEEITEVTIHGNRMYGSVRDTDGAVYLVGYELN
jgi:hypothetical protein